MDLRSPGLTAIPSPFDLSIAGRAFSTSPVDRPNGLTCSYALVIVSVWFSVVAATARATDTDGDGIHDEVDVCPDTPLGLRVDPHGRPAVDYNLDCQVNGLDLPGFIQRLLTPATAPAATLMTVVSATPESSGYFGISVAGVPDVDGDGLTDLLAGAKLENPPGSPNDCGRAHLYSGRTGALLRTFASPHQESDGRFAWGVGALRDIDGDGRGDVIIGAPLESPPGAAPKSGRAYLFSGATGALLQTFVSPNGTQSGLFAYCVSNLADVDGDGKEDVLVGAWHESSPGDPPDTGRAYVFSSTTGNLLYTLASPNQTVSGYFGVSVSAVQDTNGDGRDDILVGAPGEPTTGAFGAGRAYLYSGADGSLLHTFLSPNEQELGNFGVSVSGMADVNGDGRGDVVIGASTETVGKETEASGRAYIFSGASGQLLQSLDTPSPSFYGSFGNAVAGVADIDGDMRGDVVIAASSDTSGGSPFGAGRAYVFSGANGTLMREMMSPNEEAGSTFGFAVAGLDDATGDGRGDVLVAGLFDNPPPLPVDAGAVYLFNIADSDADGVPDANDECPDTPANALPVDLQGRPGTDFNFDCQIDTSDIPGFVEMLLSITHDIPTEVKASVEVTPTELRR